VQPILFIFRTTRFTFKIVPIISGISIYLLSNEQYNENKMKNFKKNKFTQAIMVGTLSAVLSACGSDNDKDTTPPTNSTPPPATNTAPTITSTSVVSIDAAAAYSYTIAATDADDDTLTLSSSTLPTWLTFDASTGLLSGTPAESDTGTHDITLSVNDGTITVDQTFTITVSSVVVTPTNNAPVITSTGATSVEVGAAYSYTLTATDADNDALTMSTTIPAALSWLTFDEATGVLSGTPASGDVTATPITLAVNDGTVDTEQTFTITVTDVFIPPVGAVVYNDAENPVWPSWTNAGPAPQVVMDADTTYGNVMQFSINNPGDGTVVGFNARDAVDGVAQSITPGTTLEFDFKLTAMPTAGVIDWRLKLEDSEEGANEVALSSSQEAHATPVLDTWMHYSFNVDTYGLTDTDLIMIFPAWAQGDGAEYSIDNVTFTQREVVISTSGGNLVVDSTVGIDFEGTESEQAMWEAFENGDSPALEFVANPDMVGNTSATVAKLTLADAADNNGMWAGAVTRTVQPFALNSTNSTVKVWVYKSKISPVGIKFEKCVGSACGAHAPRFEKNTKINEGEALTIDFSAYFGLPENDAINGIAIYPDNEDGRDENIVYFDNITLSGDAVVVPPVAGAPTTLTTDPSLAASDVVSLHTSGDVYTNITVNDWNPNWGQGGSLVDETIAGKTVKKVELVNYQGIDFAATDITGKATLHMSVYAESDSAFNVFVITGAAEQGFTTGNFVAGAWNEIEVDLSATGDLNNAFQIKFDGGAGDTYWLDNIYFH
jgi:hypothetical protein